MHLPTVFMKKREVPYHTLLLSYTQKINDEDPTATFLAEDQQKERCQNVCDKALEIPLSTKSEPQNSLTSHAPSLQIPKNTKNDGRTCLSKTKDRGIALM
jgi:hypothetical protein